MKLTLKNTLMTLTMLSTGFFLLSSEAALAGYKSVKAKPSTATDENFKQYPKLGEAKEDVNFVLDIHQTGVSLPAQKEQIEKYQEDVDKYNEIVRRLNQNKQCNIALLNANFSNGNAIWKRVAAYAEDSSAALLAQASSSLGASEASGQLKAMESRVDSGDISDQGDPTGSSSTSSPFSSINENTSDAEANAMVKAGQKSAQDQADAASESDMDLGEAAVFGKVRWDVGYAILKDIYRYPKKWGNLTKAFSPWVDQKYVYDQYLENFYKDKEKHYNCNLLNPCPSRPKLTKHDSYLPEDYYNGEIPNITVSNVTYNESTATPDERWCGQTNGKKNVCTRINKGPLYMKHLEYIEALQEKELKEGHTAPSMDPPYLPQAPLPPWRESVYIMNVEKELPEFASELPEPWYMVTQDIDNYTSQGELSNLVQKHGQTIRYRPGDYKADTGEIKKDIFGNPKLPIPLISNRISAYLALLSAKEEQEPIKDKAVAAIKDVNAKLVASLKEFGCVIPNADTFNLNNPADYNLALKELKRVKNLKVSSAKARIQNLKATFKKVLPSVKQMLAEELQTLNAVQKDVAFLVSVTRDNAADINSLLLKAIADIVANESYKQNVEEQMEDAASIPSVGCPVL